MAHFYQYLIQLYLLIFFNIKDSKPDSLFEDKEWTFVIEDVSHDIDLSLSYVYLDSRQENQGTLTNSIFQLAKGQALQCSQDLLAQN